jgi:hypothetical protein
MVRSTAETAIRDEVAEIRARDALQEHIDVLKNKLAALIVNAELLTEMVDGEAGDRAQGLLRSARSAAGVVSSLQGCLR